MASPKPVSTQKSSKATIKSAAKKQRLVASAEDRGFGKDKASRKEMKKEDTFYNKMGKRDLKQGKMSAPAMSSTSKSQSKSKIKVPVKGRGGLRGGGLNIGDVQK
jgi:hypothetical protein